jgi:hypothetical protein
VLLIFFIVHGFVVNNAVLLCGFKQTKGKRHENSDSLDWTAAGISGCVCVNHLWPVVAGGGGMSDFWKDYEPEPTRPAPMTTDRALDLALEWQNKDWNSESPMSADLAISEANDVINALMQALEAPVQDVSLIDEGKTVAPVQEPLMVDIHPPATQRDRWMYEQGRLAERDPRSHTTPLPAQPAPAPGYCKHCKQYTIEEPLPAAQRQWVGLTDEEVTLCHSLAVLSKKHDGTDPSFITLLHRQIEAKLKEKNNG